MSPQTPNHQDLAEIINRLREIPIGAPFDALSLKRDWVATQSFLEAVPARAHSVLGIIATIRGDEAGMRNHFRAARRIDPNGPYVRVNHIVALQGFSCFSEAVAEAREACREHPRNPALLSEAALSCIYAGRFQEAAHWLEARERAGEGEPIPGTAEAALCQRFLLEKRLSDQDVEAVQQEAAQLLRDEEILGPVIHYSLRREETDHWVSLRFVIRQPPRRVADMEWELAGRLARSDLPERAFRHVVVGFLSQEENA